jgi:hypothetical protein
MPNAWNCWYETLTWLKNNKSQSANAAITKEDTLEKVAVTWSEQGVSTLQQSYLTVIGKS